MYRLAAIFVVFGAIIHGTAFVLGKFGADVQSLLIFTVLYLVLAVFLIKQKRWSAWLTFLVGLTGLVVALLGVNNSNFAPNEVFYVAALLNFIAAVCAFVILWQSQALDELP